ncbi:MAG: hypothetical protein U0637_15205 [Phycisphaerales bacterium]
MNENDSIQPDPTMERDATLPPRLRDVAAKWLLRVSVLAFVVSIVLHLTGGVIARYITIGHGGGAAVIGEGEGPVEMAILSEGDLKGVEANGLDVNVPAIANEVAASNAAVPSLTEVGPSDSGSVSLGDVSDVGAISGGGNISGGPEGSMGGAGGTGGGGGTSFFGVEAAGTRFAFIVDFSASMEGQKIARLKQELRESLDRMAETNEFIIVTFSDTTTVLGGRKEWREATSAGRKKMYPFIEAQGMGSNTLPLPAFHVVFGELRPRPDAIYFMTDGEFDEAVVQEVALMESKLPQPVPVHCICFASQSGEVLMKQIAQKSKGTYTFVAGP